MNGKASVLAGLMLAVSVPTMTGAQTAVQAHEAELRTTSGNTDGTIVMVADYVLFVDDGRATGSFALDRANVEKVTARDRVVTFHLRGPVRTRFGLTEAVSLQVNKSVDIAVLARWPGEAPVATVATGTSGRADGEATVAYQAKHDHLPPRGSCESSPSAATATTSI